MAQKQVVAFVGNPNAGKTTLFNAITGSHQKVANYPGVTVESVSADITVGQFAVHCVDIPGIYSIEPVSEDEIVAVNEILQKPNLLVYVVDANNLERNLYLFSQLAEMELPVIVALTMADVAEKKGLTVDSRKLANLLGVDVIPVIAHKKSGLRELFDAIERNLEEPRPADREFGYPVPLEAKVSAFKERLARAGWDVQTAQIRKAFLTEGTELERSISDVAELIESFHEAKTELLEQGLVNPTLDVSTRYQWAAVVQRAVVKEPQKAVVTITDRLDKFLTHRFFGMIVFFGVMYVVFQSIYTFSAPMMDAIGAVFDKLGDLVSPYLERWPILQSLVVTGLIGGVGGVLTFLPQILILFFFIAALEGTGYLARAAFLMDRLLGWCGLNGRAFIPLLSSFACAVPGIMSARVMPDSKSRLATILVAPLMSCSARLPVYLLLIGAFIEPRYGAAWAGFALFAMHLLGLFVAIPVVFILNKGLIKGKRLPFVLELPPYQWPKWKDVWLAMLFRGKVFVKTAGTIIVVMSIAIWALLYFPRSAEDSESFKSEITRSKPAATQSEVEQYIQARQIEESYLGKFGKTIEPAFIPAGFDWRLTTAILAAFPAREVVVAELGIVFNLGGDVDEESGDLRQALKTATWPDGRPLVTVWTAIGLMVFFALCCQCMATLAAVKRETNSWKWAAFMFFYMTILAYLGAVFVHQLGRWLN